MFRRAPSLPPNPDLLEEAGRCVACGLCLPHCPTYRKTLNEADSPRGRIALMRGVLEGRVPLNERLVGHLDLCLGCRACENACPSRVEYGKLADGMREIIEPRRRRPLLRKLTRQALLAGAARPAWLKLGGYLLRGWQGVAGRRGLPEIRPFRHGRTVYPAAGQPRGEIGLFLGCVARLTDAETLASAIYVLNRLGYTVHVPPGQTCCGALHLHEGAPEKARLLQQQNLLAFRGLELTAVVHAASACGATLRDSAGDGGAFPAPVREICDFLHRAEGWEGVRIAPLEAVVAVHEPCSLRNVLHGEKAPYGLLARIPGATVIPLPGNDQCCGAGGLYRLEQPEMADTLLRDKIEAVKASGASIAATTNPGCAMHLAAGLRAAGMTTGMRHPVTLLARQMGMEILPK
ncbi:MAG: (Fe-S)-binding protein [Pseudomonadota bacterium]